MFYFNCHSSAFCLCLTFALFRIAWWPSVGKTFRLSCCIPDVVLTVGIPFPLVSWAGRGIRFICHNSTCLNIIIWTASSEFGTYRLCEQRRFRRTCASAQSRQNLRCSLIQELSQEEPSDRKPDPWLIWMAGHAQLKFVMTECSKAQIRLTGLICLRLTFSIYRMLELIPSWCFSVHFWPQNLITLFARSFRRRFFAYHYAVNHPHTNIILSWFSIPLVLKCTAKILKIGLQIKI